MNFWKTKKQVNYLRAGVNVVLLLIVGLGLFVLSTQLVEPFAKVVKAMKTVSLLEWEAWALALSIALPVGLFWLFFYVVFEAVKEDLLATLFERDAKPTSLVGQGGCKASTLQRRRRSQIVLRRLSFESRKSK